MPDDDTPLRFIIDGRRRRKTAYRVTLNDKDEKIRDVFFNLLRSRGLRDLSRKRGPRKIFSLVTPSGILIHLCNRGNSFSVT